MNDPLKNDAKEILDRAKSYISRSSFTRQICAGSATGWVTGVVFSHVGKGVVIVAGCGVIAYQVALHKGYIQSDWETVKKEAQRKTSELRQKPAVNQIQRFASKNKTFTAGFIGGFLLGAAF